ncbi:MAG: hypothetical protein WBB01_22840 [Phormidesmis sp.]
MIVAKKSLRTTGLANSSADFWLSLWDQTSGGLRFTVGQPATLMATAYSVLGLEFVNGLEKLSAAQRTAIIDFLMAGSNPDGSFQDPLFQADSIQSQEQDLFYFQEETTTFCQQALDALQAPPPPPREWQGWDTAEGLIQYFESIAWKNPWLDSNRVMFALSQLCHESDRHHRPELLTVVDAGLDWLDGHQSARTGLWKGSHEISLTNAMAATFHFTFYYGFRHRPLRYAEQIIDSCLSLQASHGLFSGEAVGQTCLDYDAIDLLAKSSLVSTYRAEEVAMAMQRARTAVLRLSNEDGGFANCKESVRPNRGRKARLLRKLQLSKLAPPTVRVPKEGRYSVCWDLLSCDNASSNAFSTWFRLIGVRLASQNEWLNTEAAEEFTFRRLPFLGYHNPSAVMMSLRG